MKCNSYIPMINFLGGLKRLRGSNLKEKEGIIRMMKLIYLNGVYIKKAHDFCKIKKTRRSVERNINMISGGEFTLQALRLSWALDNPTYFHKQISKRKKRVPLSLKLRWNVFERNDFKCVVCGRGKGEIPLHVDHIIPVSFGGSDELNNLRTLCAECNMGRGNGNSSNNTKVLMCRN